MALTKNRILWWIGIELLILIVFAIGVVVRYVLNYMYVNPTLFSFSWSRVFVCKQTGYVKKRTSKLNHWFFFPNRVAGDNQSDVDIIVTFAVLGFCLLLLLVTVAVYLRSYENETSKVTWWRGSRWVPGGFGPPINPQLIQTSNIIH